MSTPHEEVVPKLEAEVNALKGEVAALKAEVQTNTRMTAEIKDILVSFRVIAAVAKWITTVGAGAAIVWALFHAPGAPAPK